jgi:hypothetical protein
MTMASAALKQTAVVAEVHGRGRLNEPQVWGVEPAEAGEDRSEL